MIDPHVHLRDWVQSRKETVSHGLDVARRVGLQGVFEMPNTDPPLTRRDTILRRIQLADDAASPVFHGLYAGLTSDPVQIEEMLRAHADLFPRVVGFKLYAGSTTGDLAVTDESEQKLVFRLLAAAGYRGVLAVHCEKESLIHGQVRPPEAEIESVRDIIRMAGEAGFGGTLHICHVSTPQAVRLIVQARKNPARRITCGATPHHLLLSEDHVSGPDGCLLRMNPPLREETLRSSLMDLLWDGSIDWIESDHAPHLAREKREGVSGIPVLPIYPVLLQYLQRLGLGQEKIRRLVHDNIHGAFGTPSNLWAEPQGPGRHTGGDPTGEYDFDPFAGWKKDHPLSAQE